MTWYYLGRPVTSEIIEDNVGFVYLITNTVNGRQYIGKKLFLSKKKKQVKGKKKRITVESDWQDYYSSCEELKQDVTQIGEEFFHREIIHLCKSKGTANYLELREQMDRRVLESDHWYNNFVGSRIHKKHVRL